jgi:hypothetical protein
MILTTVVDALLYDESRTFVVSEFEFFKMWWNLQHDRRKDDVRQLVKNGQLEFVNGGMSSADEACPTYDLFINNFYEAQRFITQEFGEAAAAQIKTGWQLDPFGHSQGFARVASELGYESLFFARMD